VKLPSGLAPLRERDFALYWYGQVTSQIGTWANLTTTSWLLYQLTSSPVLLGLNGLARFVPVLLFTPLGGAVADRVRRRRLVTVLIAGQAVVALAVGALVLAGAIEAWHLYLATALIGTLTSFEQPARLAMYPSLVPRALLPQAVILQAMLHRASTLIGPAIAGVIIARFGPGIPYLVNFGTFIAIVAALLAIRAPDVAAGVASRMRTEIVDGFRYIRRHRVLPAVFVAEVAVSLFGYNTALITIYASDVLKVDAQGLGILLASVGAGAFVGVAFFMLAGDVRRKGAVMLVGGIAYAAALLAFGYAPVFVSAVGALVAVGLADSMWGSMRNTIMQTAISDAYRGRVMSLNILVTRGLTNLSQTQTGLAVSAFGPVGAVVLAASVIAATVAGTAGASRDLRAYESAAEPLEAGTEAVGAEGG
jgi:MFS family permease